MMSRKMSCALVAAAVAVSWPVSSAMAQLTVCTPNAALVCGAQGPDQNCGCDWSDDFEQHALGEIPVDGAGETLVFDWKGWANDTTVLGEVTTEQDHTTGTGQSLAIDANDDTIRRFLGEGTPGDQIGYDPDVSDCWTFTGWWYVPGGHTGNSFFISNSRYDGTQNGTTWHTQVNVNGSRGTIVDDLEGGTLPLVTDQWVMLEVQMNYKEADNSEIIFYNGQLLTAYIYATGGAQSRGSWPETAFFGNIDLFNSSGSRVYWDDLSMTQVPCPTVKIPSVGCVGGNSADSNGCAEKIWRFTNNNLNDNVAEFYLDIEAGDGGNNPLCVGSSASTAAITPPTGWTVINCQPWTLGHALFKFTADTALDEIPPGVQVSGLLSVDANLSVEVVSAAGVTVPPFSISIAVAQALGNEVATPTACTTGGFGPTVTGQKWSSSDICAAFLAVPATTTWAKIVLALALVCGGAVLVIRSRRNVVA